MYLPILIKWVIINHKNIFPVVRIPPEWKGTPTFNENVRGTIHEEGRTFDEWEQSERNIIVTQLNRLRKLITN